MHRWDLSVHKMDGVPEAKRSVEFTIRLKGPELSYVSPNCSRFAVHPGIRLDVVGQYQTASITALIAILPAFRLHLSDSLLGLEYTLNLSVSSSIAVTGRKLIRTRATFPQIL